MKWKKLLSVMIVSVLVIGAFTVISGSTRGDEIGERVEVIDFGITFDMEDGALAASQGETHLFMHSVDGPIWQGLPSDVRAGLATWEVFGSYNNWFLNPAHEGWETAEILAAEEAGWIEDPEDVKYLANNFDDVWTVNPFSNNDIRFAMQYLNRESIIEDLLLGWGDARFGPSARSLEVWQTYFVDEIEERYGLSPEGDWDLVEDIVDNAMNDIADHVATHPNMGEVTGSREDGWYYNHPEQDEHQIEIIIMARTEDWRLDKGEWTASRLEDLGFDVTVDPTDSASAIPQAFFGAPHPYDDLGYHIYTGGWISTAAVFYQEAAFSQMHWPWYGFMQTYGPEERWQYNDEGYGQPIGPSDYVRDLLDIPDWEGMTVEDADNLGQDLFAAVGVETEDDYWDMKIETAQHGFEEAVRVFAVTEIALYPYNPDKLLAAVPESVNGYDTFFGPRTMRTDDGRLDTDILSGVDRPYMDNWNMHEGSADVYGEYQRRLAREYGTWMNPQTGLPMEVNSYWSDNEGLPDERTHPFEIDGNVESDYEYDEGVLIENLDIPMDDAVDYVAAYVEDLDLEWDEDDEIWTSSPVYSVERRWMTASEMNDTEEAVLTTDEEILTDPDATEEELIEYVPLHAGLADEKAALAVTFDPHTLHTWHDGTPMDLRDVMTHYARTRELGDPGTEPYLSGVESLNAPGWRATHAIEWNAEEGTYTVYGDYTFPMDDKAGNFYSVYPWDGHPLTYIGWDILHTGDDYNYETGVEGQEWIHQLSTEHSEDMIAALEDWFAEEGIPWYLDEANMPESMEGMHYELSELQDMVDSFDAFIDDTGHSFIGIGPYRIDDYDEVDHDMAITRWDQYGYPLAGETATDVLDRRDDIDPDDYDDYIVDGMEDFVFEFGYWSDQFEIEQIRFDLMEVTPDELNLYEEGETGDIDIFVDATWVALFPEPDTRAVTEDDLDDYFIRLAESERGPAVEVDGEPMEIYSEDITLTEEDGFSEFFAEMNVADVGTGIYSMEFRARADEDDPYSLITRDVIIRAEEFHTLTLGAEEGGTTDPEPDTYEFEALEEVDLTAIPDEGYEFDEWVGDVPFLDRFDEEITLLMDGDKDVTATFEELPQYELTINAEEGGTTDPEPGTYTYYEGEEVTVEAIPDEDWFFDEWTGDYESDEEVITFEIMEDMEITAWFTEDPPEMYELTVNIDGEGTVSIDPDLDEYEEGTEVTLTAEPADDWEFVEWTGDETGTDTTLTFTMDEDKEITAVFEEEEVDDGIPGFTLALLVLGTVIAIAIYYKKEQ